MSGRGPRASGLPAGRLLALLFPSFGCADGDTLLVSPPGFGPEVQTVFWALVQGDAEPVIEAASVLTSPVRIELSEPISAGSELYALGDPISLAEHGLEPGRVARANDGEGRALASAAVQVTGLDGASLSWRPAGLSASLARFRFQSRVAESRCATLQKVAEYPYERFVPADKRIPTFLALDDERLLVLPSVGSRAAVITTTSTQAVELGIEAVPRTARSVYRAPDGEIFIGSFGGALYQGRLETGFRRSMTLEGPPRSDELNDHPASIRAFAGPRDSSRGFELYAATYAHFFRVQPGPELIYERPPDGSGRQVGNAVWLAPGRVLFTLDDERVVRELRNGALRTALAASDVGGLDYVPGFGAVLVTWDGRLYQYDEATGEFSVIAQGLSSRVVSFAGSAERIFVFSEDGVLDQFVPGEPLCPRIAQGHRNFARIVSFGRYLAKTGDSAIEIFEIIPPD